MAQRCLLYHTSPIRQEYRDDECVFMTVEHYRRVNRASTTPKKAAGVWLGSCVSDFIRDLAELQACPSTTGGGRLCLRPVFR
jgi:hypothetical protein